MKATITVDQAVAITDALRSALRGLVDGGKTNGQIKGESEPASESARKLSAHQIEDIYQHIKSRLIDECRIDPLLLHLLTQRPEIVVEVEPRVVSIGGASLRGRIARLMATGWFSELRKQGAVRSELARTGSDVNSGNLSTAINEFVRDGFLTRESDGYRLAPGIKVTEREVVTG